MIPCDTGAILMVLQGHPMLEAAKRDFPKCVFTYGEASKEKVRAALRDGAHVFREMHECA